MATIYWIPHDKRAEHQQMVQVGLSRMIPDYLGEACWSCHGSGYNERSFWECQMCEGTGMQVAGHPAPMSVLNQVLVAAEPVTKMKKFLKGETQGDGI
jgi:hypothetical protein